MDSKTDQNRTASRSIIASFDTVLGKHLERLFGSRYGIGNPPIDLTTITCLLLLAERETEINRLASAPPERYTAKSLLQEVRKIGLDPAESLDHLLHNMVRRGYFEADERGRYHALKPARSMANLLTAVFPKMPGMNLVAYFVQTIDEVRSERKKLDEAVSQFDQVLHMQGSPLEIRKPHVQPKKQPGRPGDRFMKPRKQNQLRTVRPQSRIISSQVDSGQVEMRSFFSEQDTPSEDPHVDPSLKTGESCGEPEASSDLSSQRIADPALDTRHLVNESSQEAPVESSSPAPQEPQAVSEPQDREPAPSKAIDSEEQNSKPIQKQGAFQHPGSQQKREPMPEPPLSETVDDMVERQIAAFEEDLVLQCPLCKTGRIQIHKTPTGNIYYQCSNKDCNFISWGKPRHVVCPRCGNPFMVESSDRDGNTILKCPRATCRYRQRDPEGMPNAGRTQNQAAAKPSTPRRKAVRRRVVRRKSTKQKKAR